MTQAISYAGIRLDGSAAASAALAERIRQKVDALRHMIADSDRPPERTDDGDTDPGATTPEGPDDGT